MEESTTSLSRQIALWRSSEVTAQRARWAKAAVELDLGTFMQSATILLSDNLDGFHAGIKSLENHDETLRISRSLAMQLD
jgi:hypothetical protein